MTGLVLKLSPKERVLINGAVIENGDRRSRLAIMNPEANILRLRDALHPEDAKNPGKTSLVSFATGCSRGESKPDEVYLSWVRQIEEIRQVSVTVTVGLVYGRRAGYWNPHSEFKS